MKFREGQKVKSVFWPEGGELCAGSADVISLRITMQNGQMAEVPWLEVFYTDGRRTLFNLALVEGVQISEKTT